MAAQSVVASVHPGQEPSAQLRRHRRAHVEAGKPDVAVKPSQLSLLVRRRHGLERLAPKSGLLGQNVDPRISLVEGLR
jgi:hypothetical protein